MQRKQKQMVTNEGCLVTEEYSMMETGRFDSTDNVTEMARERMTKITLESTGKFKRDDSGQIVELHDGE